MKTIGFAGTAKNTGKTTAALQLMELAYASGYRMALTSIGYDGEAIDNVTGLPKPRYQVQSDTLIATAEGCLTSGSAGCSILNRSGIQTGLGEVVIAQVKRPGTVVLAGPNKRRELEPVLALLAEMDVALTIADGALNRLTPLLCADGLALCSGAAYEPSIPRLAEHLAALCALFEYGPSTSQVTISQPCTPEVAQSIVLEFKDGSAQVLPHGSLLGASTLQPLIAAACRPVRRLLIPGACLPALLRELRQQRAPCLQETQLVFTSPLHLIASAGPLEWQSIFQGEDPIHPAFLETLPLLFVTVNPFYPRYHPKTGDYEPACVDKAELLSTCQARIPCPPVLDVRQPPLPNLLALIGLCVKEPIRES